MKSGAVTVCIHPSQFPENVRRDLLASLRTRQVNHKFHYDSVKQTQKWLALHQIYSPARNDLDCAATYDRAFNGAMDHIKSARVYVIGLGCGGGQKDTRLLRLLFSGGKEVSYSPLDVSVAMTLAAVQTASSILPASKCHPFVCDLATANDLADLWGGRESRQATRLLTFFGMIPNFEPQLILSKLAALTRHQDWLLFSANLAPGEDYAAGVEKVLPQYDNEPTREWLLTFLLDLGVERGDGRLRFQIEPDAADGLRRIEAVFQFGRPCQIAIEASRFSFATGDSVRLFFSYRYTVSRVEAVLERHGLKICEKWVAASEEEGVFLCRKK